MAEKQNDNNTSYLRKINEHAAFYTNQDHVDTVVFVHGLKGHYQRTWGKFPELLVSDPDLPLLDILLWGYKSYAILPTNDTSTEGAHLLTTLGTYINHENAIHLVAHSMGSLVILQGLIGEMIGQRANQHPVTAVSFISLFASPVNGSNAAAIVNKTFRKLTNNHIKSLAKGDNTQMLLNEVINRIYKPDQNDSSARRIPIRMIMATQDGAVPEADRDSAKTTYRTHQPKQFNYDHSAVKEPESHFDERYRALSEDLQAGLAKRFHEICCRFVNGTSDAKREAETEFIKRYEALFTKRYVDSGRDPYSQLEDYQHYINVAIEAGARHERPPFDIANHLILRWNSPWLKSWT